MTTLVLDLDDWPRVLGEPVSEPRLLAAVPAAVGEQVEQLLTPPGRPGGRQPRVPVTPFRAGWRCPLGSLLAPIDHGRVLAARRAWRPERTTYVHEGCPKGHGRRPPTAFSRPLPHGLPERPPRLPVGGVPARGRALPGNAAARRSRRGRSRRRRAAVVRRVPATTTAVAGLRRGGRPRSCRRAVAAATPHLGISEACNQMPETLILGASNAWFAVQSSVLSIPSQGRRAHASRRRARSILDALPPGRQFLEFTLKSNAELKKLQALQPPSASRRSSMRSRSAETVSAMPTPATCAPPSGRCSRRPVRRPRRLTSSCAPSIRERLYATSGDDGSPWPACCSTPRRPTGGHAGRARVPASPALRPAAAPGARARSCAPQTRCAPSTTRRADSSINAAACHACQFASETSCERGNRCLDRATISTTLLRDNVSYFPVM
jgi:hypothetical protein